MLFRSSGGRACIGSAAVALAEVNWNARYVTIPWLRVGHVYAFEVGAVALCAAFVALQIVQSAAKAAGTAGR